jgi:hypothetical protein
LFLQKLKNSQKKSKTLLQLGFWRSLKQESEKLLLQQLASTEAVVWSPYDAHEAAQTLSELLTAAKQEGNA